MQANLPDIGIKPIYRAFSNNFVGSPSKTNTDSYIRNSYNIVRMLRPLSIVKAALGGATLVDFVLFIAWDHFEPFEPAGVDDALPSLLQQRCGNREGADDALSSLRRWRWDGEGMDDALSWWNTVGEGSLELCVGIFGFWEDNFYQSFYQEFDKIHQGFNLTGRLDVLCGHTKNQFSARPRGLRQI